MKSNFVDDKELIKALSQGAEVSNSAIKWLFKNEKLKGITKKIVSERGGSKEDTEDVFTEAVVSLIKNIVFGNFRGESKISTYFYGICQNIYLDKYSKKTKILPLKEAASQRDLNPNIEHKIIADEQNKIRKNIYQWLLKQLSDKCQKALTLQGRGISMKDIAREMSWVTSQAAKNYTFKCRKKMRELMFSNDDVLKILNKKA